MRLRTLLLFWAATWMVETPSALTHSRSYQWSFGAGNLAANWSFENHLEFWVELPMEGLTVNARLKAQGSGATSAKSGSFVAKVAGTNTGASYQALRSAPFPIQSEAYYTLSLYYKASGLSGQVRPGVMATLANGSYSLLSGTAFSSTSDWKLAVFPLATPTSAQSLRIIVAEYLNGAGGTFYFDDVVLDEGWLDSNEVKENRKKNTESVVFGDALGRAHQTQMKISGSSDQYLVGGTGFDDFARPESSYLPTPYALSAPAFQGNLLAGAQGFYNGSGPFNAKGYPFSKVQYADELGGRVLESSAPDSAWQFGKGHTVKQDFYFVNDTLVPSNIENPGTNNAQCRYRLDWSKSPDSSFTLTWTNKLGQVVRTAQNLTRTSSAANTWKWSTTRQEYYPSGQVKKVRTPLDDSAGSDAFAEVSQFNGQGQIISAYSPDRNLRKFWYNRFGQIRYSQDSVQRADSKYTYFEYDDQGRLVSQGTQVTSSLPQDSVDKDTYSQGTKTEEVGFIYEDTSSFYVRTGFTLQEILGGWKGYVDLKYGRTRLFCKYHRNQGNATPKFTAKDKFVADFFTYDSHGNVVLALKYIGPIRDPLKRLQDIWYGYDSQDRLTNFIQYASASQYTVSNSQTYAYDDQSRVSAITGVNGKPLARYVYNDWGPLDEVELGGLPTGDSSTAIGFGYNSHGGVREIGATGIYNMGSSTQRIFQQFLGYENKAYPASGVPAPLQSRFDGTITQQVYKYTSDMDAVKPVRASNYAYDLLGRMSQAQAYLNTNASPLIGSSQVINDATLTMDTTGSLSSRFEYDLNGRISGQRSAGASPLDSAKYFYKTNSYRLDRVTGKLASGSTREMSSSGTFVYDGNGAMIQDKSKKLRIDYGWDGLPTSFTLDTIAPMGTLRCCTYDANSMPMHFKVRYPSLAQYNFYDADGNRVSRVEVESKPALRTRSTHYVYMAPGMLKEWQEEYHLSGRIKKTSATVSLFGVASQIGRIRPDGKYDFFVKGYNGSTMLTVDDRGRYSDGRAMDYLAYGSYKDLKVGSTDPVTQKWTGKELEAMTGLYAFGKRWFDPELAMWFSPDPIRQFHNPYTYGWDPINGIDRDGACIDGITTWFCVAAAVVVATVACDALSDDCHDAISAAGDWLLDKTGASSIGADCSSTGGCNVTADGAESNPNHDTKSENQKDDEASASTNKAIDNALNSETIQNKNAEMFAAMTFSPASQRYKDLFGNYPDSYNGMVIGRKGYDEFDALQTDPLFRFNRNVGVPTGRAVGHFIDYATPMGSLSIPFRIVGGGAVKILPQAARIFLKAEEAFSHLRKFHGILPELASQRLHAIKKALGRGGADNVLFDRTGGVWDPVTREFLGSLTEGGAKSVGY